VTVHEDSKVTPNLRRPATRLVTYPMAGFRHPYHAQLVPQTEGQRQASSQCTPALRLLMEVEFRLEDVQCFWEATDRTELATTATVL
jgi:hypothetical protein